MKYVVTIGREYGSGGREIGEKLAEILGIPCYDKLIVDKIAQSTHFDSDIVQEMEENGRLQTRFAIFNNYYGTTFSADNFSIADQINVARIQAIIELALKGSCIFVGRAADYVLAGKENVISVFVKADQQAKIERVMKRVGVDEKDAEKLIKQVNKNRAGFYNFNTDRKWGSALNYDLIINSSKLGIEKSAQMIADYVKLYTQE